MSDRKIIAVAGPTASGKTEYAIKIALENNRKDVGREYEVLVEGESHRSKEQLFGRNSQNKVIVFDRGDALPGTYRHVKVEGCTAATLLGRLTD